MSAAHPSPRPFRQISWNEPLIIDQSVPGTRGCGVPGIDETMAAAVGDPLGDVPAELVRDAPPALPELSQPEVLRHYLRLSQETLGNDVAIAIGLGTCTMKHSPKAHERLIRSPAVADLHPRQPDATVQGILEIYHGLEQMLCEVSGLDRFSFQPGGGTQAVYANARMIRAYHDARGDAGRDEIVTTLFSHPCDGATPATAGYKVITLYPGPNGYPEPDALRAAVSDRTAALMIANPEDTGIYNPHIDELVRIVHEAGGLCHYDQANANGILGITRAREAGFDVCQFNLHKTFAAPHCSMGMPCGASGVTAELARFLPTPTVEKVGERYVLDHDRPDSIGKLRAFHGVVAAVVRAYAWILTLGPEGLREAAECAVLNNNYLVHLLSDVPGLDVSYAEGNSTRRLEQVRYSWERLAAETGVTTMDIARRTTDFGVPQYFPAHEPWVIAEPMTLEPSESFSRADLEAYAAIIREVAREAYEEPGTVLSAPHRSAVHKMDEDALHDPERWATTWRVLRRREAAVGD